MKKIIFVLFIFPVFLLSCGKTQETTNTSPYPTVPMGATEVSFMPGHGYNFKASGTEPFWWADITANATTFTRPGEAGITEKVYQTAQDEKDGITVIKDVKWEFFITLKKEPCSDGMSDIVYGYSASVAVGAENLKGCANKN